MHGIIYAHKWFLYVSESTYIICIVNMCSHLMTTEKKTVPVFPLIPKMQT